VAQIEPLDPLASIEGFVFMSQDSALCGFLVVTMLTKEGKKNALWGTSTAGKRGVPVSR
jgi:hypothetical protein